MPDYIVPEGSAVITPNAMFEELRTIGGKVDHLAAVVDPALAELRQQVADSRRQYEVTAAKREAQIEKVGVRVTALEHWRWFVFGIAAVVGPLAGIFGSRLLGGL